MRSISRRGNRTPRTLAGCACFIAGVVAIGCRDNVAPESLAPIVPVTPTTPPPPAITLSGVLNGAAWWAGSAYPLPPHVAVFINGVRTQGILVHWAVTAGGGIEEEVVPTDRFGWAAPSQWILGVAGTNTLTASVAPFSGSGDSTRISFSVTAVAAPQHVSEYRLVLIDGFPLPPADPISNLILGGLIRLGDNGTYEFTENDTDLGTQFTLFGVGAYQANHAALALSAISGLEGWRFPADSAVVVGDTLTTAFVKDFEIGLDPAPTLIHETYVRVAPTAFTSVRAAGNSLVSLSSRTRNSRATP